MERECARAVRRDLVGDVDLVITDGVELRPDVLVPAREGEAFPAEFDLARVEALAGLKLELALVHPGFGLVVALELDRADLAAFPFDDGVREVSDALAADRWGVGNRVIAVDDHSAGDALGDAGHRESIAVHVYVVVQHSDVHGRVLVYHSGVLYRLGHIVDLVDGHVHFTDAGATLPIADDVVEGVRAVEVGVGRVGQGIVRVDDD